MGHLVRIVFSNNALPNKYANYYAINEAHTVKFKLILPVKKKLFYKSPSFVCRPPLICSSEMSIDNDLFT